MTGSSRRIWAALLFVPAAMAWQKPAASNYAGLISDVQGKGACFLQRSGLTRQITLKDSGGAYLRVGDKVRCDSGGSLVLELRGSGEAPSSNGSNQPCWGCTTIGPSEANSWTTIRRVSLPRNDPVAQPVDDWFKLAGAVRGSPAPIYSPPSGSPGGAVWPDRFVIRWIPESETGNVALKIRDELGNPVWPALKDGRVNAPSGAGELTSAEARTALLAYRNSGRRGPLTLVMVNAAGDEYSVQFAVISEAEEATLRERLMVCEAQAGLTRSICRAYYFRQIGLYTEAADEYDSALTTLAPNSVDLKLHAIAALRQTGNYSREETLVRQLPAGAKPPQ